MARRKRKWTESKKERARTRRKRTLEVRRKTIARARESQTSLLGFLLAIGDYLDRGIHLAERVRQLIPFRKGPRAQFQVEHVVAGLVAAFLAGVRRIESINVMVREVALAERLGMSAFFGESTARDMLWRASRNSGAAEATQALLCAIGWENVRPDERGVITVGADWTSHRSQALQRPGVVPGHCGGKRTELCLQSSRITVQGLPLDFELHSGNVHPTFRLEKAHEVALEASRRFPSAFVVEACDSAYASAARLDEQIELARAHGRLHFVQAVPVETGGPTRRLKEHAVAEGKWHTVSSFTWVQDLGNGKVFRDSRQMCRVVAVKRRMRKYVRRKGKRRTIRVDRFYLLATDLSMEELSDRRIFRAYHQRQQIEASFCDAKQSLPYVALTCRDFQMNRLLLGIVTLAQLVGTLFQRTLVPTARTLIRTAREVLYRLPARVLSATKLAIEPAYRHWRSFRRAVRETEAKLGITVVTTRAWAEPGPSR